MKQSVGTWVGTVRFMCGVTLACLLWTSIPAKGSTEEAEPDQSGYQLHCALCHGDDGTPVAALEKVVEVEVPHLGSGSVQSKSDDEIGKVITEGEGKMNPVISIGEAEIAGVIAFVRTLKKD